MKKSEYIAAKERRNYLLKKEIKYPLAVEEAEVLLRLIEGCKKYEAELLIKNATNKKKFF